LLFICGCGESYSQGKVVFTNKSEAEMKNAANRLKKGFAVCGVRETNAAHSYFFPS